MTNDESIPGEIRPGRWTQRYRDEQAALRRIGKNIAGTAHDTAKGAALANVPYQYKFGVIKELTQTLCNTSHIEFGHVVRKKMALISMHGKLVSLPEDIISLPIDGQRDLATFGEELMKFAKETKLVLDDCHKCHKTLFVVYEKSAADDDVVADYRHYPCYRLKCWNMRSVKQVTSLPFPR